MGKVARGEPWCATRLGEERALLAKCSVDDRLAWRPMPGLGGAFTSLICSSMAPVYVHTRMCVCVCVCMCVCVCVRERERERERESLDAQNDLHAQGNER